MYADQRQALIIRLQHLEGDEVLSDAALNDRYASFFEYIRPVPMGNGTFSQIISE